MWFYQKTPACTWYLDNAIPSIKFGQVLGFVLKKLLCYFISFSGDKTFLALILGHILHTALQRM